MDDLSIEMVEELRRKPMRKAITGEPIPEGPDEGQAYYQHADELFAKPAEGGIQQGSKFLVLSSTRMRGSFSVGEILTTTVVDVGYKVTFSLEDGSVRYGDVVKNISFGNWIHWDNPAVGLQGLRERANSLLIEVPGAQLADIPNDPVQAAVALNTEIKRLVRIRGPRSPFRH